MKTPVYQTLWSCIAGRSLALGVGLILLTGADSAFGQARVAPQLKLRNLANPADRTALVAELATRARQEKDEAEGLARAKGWPIRGTDANGAKYELRRIDERGMPSYNGTDNANAAISTGASQIRNQAPYYLNGQGFTVGVWDAGAVRATHQEFATFGNTTGYPMFSVGDLVDLPSLASKLKQPTRTFDAWLAGQLSSATWVALASYQGAGSDPAPLQQVLLQDLNGLLLGASIYEEHRFTNSFYEGFTNSSIVLRSETRTLMSQLPQGSGLQRLNRLLIEDAYPLEVPTHNRVVIKDKVGEDNHATHVAGTIGASGVGDPKARGMANQVRLESYDWNNDVKEMADAAAATKAQTEKLLVSNHSYGAISGWFGLEPGSPIRYWGRYPEREDYKFGQYGSDTRRWDDVCYSAPYFLPFWAAGNVRNDTGPAAGSSFLYYDSGTQRVTNKSYNPAEDPYFAVGWDNGGFDTMGTWACGKNVLTIGAANDAVSGSQRSVANGTMSSFSGWGPTDDGRIKPDLVANGVGVYSTFAFVPVRPDSTLGDVPSDTAYNSIPGTSMASPNAAGSAILLQELYARQFAGTPMRASTLKALLIQTADDLGNPGPDYTYGWGYLNVKVAADAILKQEENSIIEGKLDASNPTDSYTFDLRSVGLGKLYTAITICWTDPPGNEKTKLDDRTKVLVNDLDIRWTLPSGVNIAMPFVLDVHNPSLTATTGDNNTDNVEQIRIDWSKWPGGQLPLGPMTLTVSHKGILTDGEQHYSLIISEGIANLKPYQPPTWSDKIVVSNLRGTADFLPSDLLTVGWGVSNDGVAASQGTFMTEVYVDGVLMGEGGGHSLRPNYFSSNGVGIGTLPPGTHTIRIKIDAAGVVPEVNETDNEYTITIFVKPANDDFANAQLLQGDSGTVMGNNLEATAEFNEPSHAGSFGWGGASVWFRWTSPYTGTATLDTLGSSFDTVLAVYTGSAVNSLTAVPNGKNDDASAVVKQSLVAFQAVAGTVYRIAVTGYGGTGEIALHHSILPPDPPDRPVITSPRVASGAQGTPFRYSITAPVADFYGANDLPPGLSISGEAGQSFDGLISGTPTRNGVFNVIVRAYNQSGPGHATVVLTIGPSAITLAQATDGPGLDWTSGGSGSTYGGEPARWFGQALATHDGVDAARSGGIGASEATYTETTVNGPGTLSFWWKVSSTAGHDYLRFTLDGAEQPGAPAISGGVDWQQRTLAIPAGSHTLRWTFSRDDALDFFSPDIAWLDQVEFRTPDYTLTTSGGTLAITDEKGSSDALTISQPAAGSIKFAAAGRIFSLNGGAGLSGDSGNISLTGVTGILVDARGGDDTINVGGFTGTLPGLSLSGGTGHDTVNLNGSITLAANADLDVNLQNDDPTPGDDTVVLGSNAHLITSGIGSIRMSVSRNLLMNAGNNGLQTEDGDIILQANQQSAQAVGSFFGVNLNGVLVQSTGTGNVIIHGRGGIHEGAQSSAGVAMDPNTTVRTRSGEIIVVGVGGTTLGDQNNGVQVHSGSVVETTGGGSISITGTGGRRTVGAGQVMQGIRILLGGVVRTSGAGAITLNGTGNPVGSVANNYGVRIDNSGGVVNTGNGTITINATGGANNAPAFDTTTGANRVGFDGVHPYSGNILIMADSMSLAEAIIQTTGIVTLRQKTDGRLINLGAADSATALGLTDAELDQVNAGTLEVGDTNSGLVTISQPISRATAGALTLNSGAALKASATGTDVTLPGTLKLGGPLACVITGAAADTGYPQLKVTGGVNLNGVPLALTGTTFVGAVGNTFTLVDNDGSDPIIGSFIGLPSGTEVSWPGSSSLAGRISYTGGTGNDAVLTLISNIKVTTLADNGPGSLRQSIADAPAGASITFAPAFNGQTLTLGGSELFVGKVLTIDASGLSKGITISGGGAHRIFTVNSGGSLTLRSLTLTGGHVEGRGGAIFGESNSALVLDRCTLTGNSAIEGGALFFGPMTLSQCTLTGNTASYGGAIQCLGLTTITRCTIAGNSAYAGGGIFNNNTTLTVEYSIVAANNASIDGWDVFNENATLVYSGANLVQSVANASGGSVTGPAAINAVPLLAPLGNYGGPTQTMPPMAGSRAIDAGGTTTLSTDQRGLARLVGIAADLGAVELNVIAISISGTGATRTLSWSPVVGTLESAPSLDPEAPWTAMGTTSPATIPVGVGQQFYRVRQ